MFKKIVGALGAIALSAGSALAGPTFYGNIENNAGWVGSSSAGNATDFAVGIKGGSGNVGWYGQVGPQIQVPNGGDTDVVLSGKAGGSIGVSDKTSIYGEVGFATADEVDNTYFTKFGLTHDFN